MAKTMSSITNGDFVVEEIEDTNHRHYFDNKDFINPYDSDVICISAGTLGPSLLKKCIPLFEEATKHRLNLEKDNAYLFQYGTYAGLWEYRDQLSKFLTRHYGENVNRRDLMLTAGATHGLVSILSTLLPSDGIIFIEETTYMAYFDTFNIFSSMKLISVPMNDEGIDTETFEKIIATEKSKRTWELSEVKMFWAMLFVVPIFHNPSGIIYSEKCCKKIVQIARETNILVLAEDIYNFLHFDNEKYPPRRLFAYDRYSEGFNGGNVISSGTFSKILSPGIRVGWMEAGPRIVRVLTDTGLLKSGGAVNHYASGIVCSIIELGLMDIHMDAVVSTLKETMSAVCDVLDTLLPSNCSYRRPNGGFFLWIKLPQGINAAEFIPWCIDKHKVNALPGFKFSLEGGFKNCMRIAISFYDCNISKEGAKRLCIAIKDYLENEINL